MKNETRQDFKSNFKRLLTANSIALIFPLIVMPLTTRLYNSSDFAILAVFASIISIGVSISTWKFDYIIPNTMKSRAVALVYLSRTINWLIASISLLVILSHLFTDFINIEILDKLGFYSLLIPFSIFIGGRTEVLQSLLVRSGALKGSAIARIYQSFSLSILQLIGGLISPSGFMLIISMLLSAIANIVVLYFWSPKILSNNKRDRKHIGMVFKKHFIEGTSSTAGALVNSFSIAVIPLLLANHFRLEEIGWYSLMYKMVIIPVSILTSSVSHSFWSEASFLVKRNPGKLMTIYLKTSVKLFFLSIFFFGVSMMGPHYIGLLLGDEWEGAGDTLASLSPLIVGYVTVQSLTHLVVYGKQHWKLVLDLVKIFLIVLIITKSGKYHLDFNSVIWMISLVFFVSYIVLFFMNFYCIYSEVNNESKIKNN